MTAVGAVRYLQDQVRSDKDLRNALAAVCSRYGLPDLPSFARDHPDEIIEIAEDYQDMKSQTPPGKEPL